MPLLLPAVVLPPDHVLELLPCLRPRGRKVAVRLRNAIVDVEGLIQNLEALVAGEDAPSQLALDEARTIAFSLGPLQHSQAVKTVEQGRARVEEIHRQVADARNSAARAEEAKMAKRRSWVLVIWGVVLANVLLFALVRRSARS